MKLNLKRLVVDKQTSTYLVKRFENLGEARLGKVLMHIDKRLVEGSIANDHNKPFAFWLADIIPHEFIDMFEEIRAAKIAKRLTDQERERKKQQEADEARTAKIWDAFKALSLKQRLDIEDRAWEVAETLKPLITPIRDGMIHRSAMSTLIAKEILKEER